MNDSVSQIRWRILGLVLRAYIGIVLATLVITLAVTAIALSYSLDIPPFNHHPLIDRLEGYYAARGSWEGAAAAFTASEERAAYLLDAQGRIVVDNDARDAQTVADLYQAGPKDSNLELRLNGEKIGALIFNESSLPSNTLIVKRILPPVSQASAFLALLATAIGVLLSRRIVAPLADVIAAARAVTAGKLDTRVQVRGPQDLLALTDSFNQMAAALERSQQERRDLLADIAHELRTPLTAIRGRLEGMLDGVYPADEAHLSLALKAQALLEHLVEDLRVLTLAESRQLPLEKKPTDLHPLAAHLVEVFSAEAREKNIRLEVRSAPGRFLASLDPQRTEQVLANLVGNALRYTPDGGQVWLTLEQTADTLQLSVCDNGPGLPAEDLPYLFDRFWRKEKSRARQAGGSGLGLAIAKQLVEVQGGTIAAENRPGGGLQVRVSVPRAKVSS